MRTLETWLRSLLTIAFCAACFPIAAAAQQGIAAPPAGTPLITHVEVFNTASNGGVPINYGDGEGGGVAYDPATGDIYFAQNPFSAAGTPPQIVVIHSNGTTTVLAPPGGFGELTAVVLYNGNLYAADGNGSASTFFTQLTPLNVIWQYVPSTQSWSKIVTGVNDPTGIAFDTSGNLYVASWLDQKVYRYPYNSATQSFGSATVFWTAPDPTAAPYAIAFDQTQQYLYVCGFGVENNNGTKVFRVATNLTSTVYFDSLAVDPGGSYFNTYPPTTSGSSQWNEPTSLFIDRNDYLYVGYYDARKIVRIAPNGTSIAVFPGGGSADDSPNGLAVTPQGDVITVVNGFSTLDTNVAVIEIHGMGPSMNAAADFSSTVNSGPWSYGYARGFFVANTFTPMSSSPNYAATDFITNSPSPYGLDFWLTNPPLDSAAQDPDVVHNGGASTLTPFCCAVIPPGGLGLQPGYYGSAFGADVRWTALFPGQYLMFGIWSGEDFSGPTNTTGRTIITSGNSSAVSNPYSINSFGPISSAPIAPTTSLSSNDTIDFNVTNGIIGSNVINNNDMTGLDAVVVQAGDKTPLSINANAVWFVTQPVGTFSLPETSTVTNNSADAQTIGPIRLVGADASDFQISGDGCSNSTVSPGGTCTFTTSFLASALGARTAFVLATSTDNSSGQVVSEQFPVVGIGVPNTMLSLSPSSNPIVSGGSVTYTATVASALAASPVGSVQFYDFISGQTPVVTVTTPSASTTTTASYTYTQTAPSVGLHAISAVFVPGNSTFVGISGTTLQETVAPPTPPTFTSANAATFPVGTATTFTVTTSGLPLPTITLTGGSPPGSLTFTAGAGTATISGTPTSTDAGSYPLTFTATSSSGTVAQIFTLTINESQSISFSPIPNHFVDDPPFAVAVNASSGLPVTLAASGNCTLSGNTSGSILTLTGAGTCTIAATQPGNFPSGPYVAAAPVIQTFNINFHPAPCPATVTASQFVTTTYTQGTIPFFGGEGAGVATDPIGNVYIAENPFPFQTATGATYAGASPAPAILMVTPDGLTQTLLAPPGGFGEVTAVAFYQGNLYVADGIGYLNHLAPGPQTTPLNVIWQYNPGSGAWTQIIAVNNPTGIAFWNGNIYVSSWQDQNVYAFSPTGTNLGTVWTAPDGTAAPYGLAFDASGNLFVAGFGGNPQGATGSKIFEVAAADVLGYTRNYSVFFDLGTPEPYSLAFDAFGNLFASYYDSGKILRITPNSSYTTIPLSVPNGSAPNGLTFDVNNNLFTVLNYGNIGGIVAKIQGVTCSPATPVIHWPTPSPILYGTPLSATQLDATAVDASNNPIRGTFVYNPLAGTVLSPGLQTLSVTFTPADTTDFVSRTASVQLTVNQAPAFTSAASATFTVGAAGSFSLTATGYPAPTFSVTAGTLPNGLTLSSSGLLSGTPVTGSGGVYNITITATNGILPDATQPFMLTITNTPVGTSVAVSPVDTTTNTSPVTLTFASVSQAGITSLATSSTGPGVPSGFSLGTPTIYYNLSTTAVYSAPIAISINFAGTTFTTTPHLFHYDTTTGTWTDITTQIIGTVIYGTVNSLSPFLVAEETPTAPAVTTNPASQTVTAGSSVMFTAAASGKPAPTAQWQVSTGGGAFTNISGATSTTLTLTAVTASMNGNQYQAVFSNGVGTAGTTTAATLTVNFAPSVTTQPSSTTVTAGSTATFTVATSGNPTPTVQWQVSTNGGVSYTTITGATSTTLALTGVTASQNGYLYEAVFTNSVGSATTAAATLTVNSAPGISTNPVSQTATSGSNATFTAAATGNPTPTVQWQVSTDGGVTFNNVSGATATTLTFTTTASQNGNEYRAVFTNSVSSATTTAATVTVNSVPTVTTNPSSQAVTAGANVTFTATASGNPMPTVQWQVITNGGTFYTNITGATSTTLTLTAVTSGMNGYQYRAVFTNSAGSATTSAATLTVSGTSQAPKIASAASADFPAGILSTFTVTTTGSPTPTITISPATGLPMGVTFVDSGNGTATLSGTPTVNGNYAFTITASNGVGTAATQSFTLTVDQAPAITSANSTSFTFGTGGTFTVTATGFPKPALSKTGTLPSGVSFDSLTGVLSGTPASGTVGTYNITFTASNGVGTAATQRFTLIVNPANQTITLTSVPSLPSSALFGQGPFTLSASATSGLQVAFSAMGNCLLSANSLSLTGAGSCTVKATQGGNGNYNAAPTLNPGFTIGQAPTTTVVSVSTGTVKYSDYASFSATVTPTSAGGQALTGNVQFYLNGSAVGSPVAISNSGVATLSQVQVNFSAGSYPVKAVFSATNANFAGSSGTTTQNVTQENAFILYSGDTIAQVGTTLNLRATVWDSAAAGYPGTNPESGPAATIGDITKMWIAFDTYPAGSCGSGTPSTLYAHVALTGTPGIGTATTTLSSTSEASYCVVSRLVAGNTGGTNEFYTAPNAQAAGLDFYVNSGQFATGGGWVNDPTGSHGNFGFNARYNSTGSPKGQMVYVYRALYNGVLADFIIKSNALTALQFTGTTYPISSTLQGKANVQVNRASDGLFLFSAGNYTFSATVTDSGQNGNAGKQFSLITYDSNGVPYHTVPAATALQGGNVVVHSK